LPSQAIGEREREREREREWPHSRERWLSPVLPRILVLYCRVAKHLAIQPSQYTALEVSGITCNIVANTAQPRRSSGYNI